MKTKDKREYALLLTPHSVKPTNERLGLGDFGTMSIHFVEIRDGFVRGASDSPFDNLYFSCQWNVNKPGEHTYGWDVHYNDVFRVNRQEAERMLTMLKRVDKAQEKFPVRPATFGQYVSLTAQALGVKRLKKQVPSNLRSGGYDDYDYSDWSAKDISWLVDSAIEEARKVKEPEVESA